MIWKIFPREYFTRNVPFLNPISLENEKDLKKILFFSYVRVSFTIGSREIKVLQILYERGSREGRGELGEGDKKGRKKGRQISLRDNDNAHLSGLETNKYTNGGQKSSSEGGRAVFSLLFSLKRLLVGAVLLTAIRLFGH